MNDDTLTPDEIAALASHGWWPDGQWTGNRLLYLRFKRGSHAITQTAQEWRAELRRMENEGKR